MKHIALAIAGAMIVLSGACKKKDSATQESTMTVDVTYPEIDTVMVRKSYPGVLTAHNEVDLVARVDGVLLDRPYSPGEKVAKGAVLFRIDETTYRNQVNQAQSALDNARSAYEYSSKEYAAMKAAFEKNEKAVSQMSVVQAKSNMEADAAQIKNYEAALNTARTTLGYCTVRAPFDGRVTVSTVDPGNYLAGAASPVKLATIYDDAKMYANVEVDNDTYMKMVNNESEGLDLKHVPMVFNETLPHEYTGDLTYMAPDVDPSTGTLKLRALIDNPYGELKSGMYVSMALPISHLDKAILIEDAAIGTDQLGKYVYVVNDSNQVIYTPIEVGEVIGQTKRIVNKGLEPSQRYVTKALLKVRNGEKVNPVEKTTEQNKSTDK